jgi:FtsZ-binding cell division protein ZapB
MSESAKAVGRTVGEMQVTIEQQAAEIERLQNITARLKQEAEGYAQEARTQRSTVHSIYQAIGAQKGDWNGATPVIEAFEKLKQECDQLKAAVALAIDTFEQYQMDVDSYPPIKHVALMQNLNGVLAQRDAEVIERARQYATSRVEEYETADQYDWALVEFTEQLLGSAEEVKS